MSKSNQQVTATTMKLGAHKRMVDMSNRLCQVVNIIAVANFAMTETDEFTDVHRVGFVLDACDFLLCDAFEQMAYLDELDVEVKNEQE